MLLEHIVCNVLEFQTAATRLVFSSSHVSFQRSSRKQPRSRWNWGTSGPPYKSYWIKGLCCQSILSYTQVKRAFHRAQLLMPSVTMPTIVLENSKEEATISLASQITNITTRNRKVDYRYSAYHFHIQNIAWRQSKRQDQYLHGS